MHKFEWSFSDIKNQEDFVRHCDDVYKEENRAVYTSVYEQLARLLYQCSNGKCIAIELQVPTFLLSERMGWTKEECGMWLTAYESDNLHEYSFMDELDCFCVRSINFDNAEKTMLKYAEAVATLLE